MTGLFKENIRIAMGSIKTQLLRTILTIFIIALGIWALVGILTVVSALENTLSVNFASMGSNTFNINQYESNTRSRGGDEIAKRRLLLPMNDAEFRCDPVGIIFKP